MKAPANPALSTEDQKKLLNANSSRRTGFPSPLREKQAGHSLRGGSRTLWQPTNIGAVKDSTCENSCSSEYLVRSSGGDQFMRERSLVGGMIGNLWNTGEGDAYRQAP